MSNMRFVDFAAALILGAANLLYAGVASSSAADNRVLASVRGYVAVNQILSDRFGRPASGDDVDLRTYLQPGAPLSIPGRTPSLTDLLGVYAGDGRTATMQNGHPNSISMLLWALAVDGFAEDVAKSCAGPTTPESLVEQTLVLNESMARAISPLCNWPLSLEATRPALQRLWDEALQADAPPQEVEAWIAFASGSEFTVQGRRAVHDLVVAMLYNPHFLLNK